MYLPNQPAVYQPNKNRFKNYTFYEHWPLKCPSEYTCSSVLFLRYLITPVNDFLFFYLFYLTRLRIYYADPITFHVRFDSSHLSSMIVSQLFYVCVRRLLEYFHSILNAVCRMLIEQFSLKS